MDNYQRQLDGLYSALGDSTRRAIVHRLAEGPASVSELATPFDMALPSVLKHLRVLERAGVIVSHKHGRTRTCSLRHASLQGAELWLAAQLQSRS